MWGCRKSSWKLKYSGIEMTSNSNGNDKFKEWREVKIIKNEHICKNLVSHI